jgi:hypothetical protein
MLPLLKCIHLLWIYEAIQISEHTRKLFTVRIPKTHKVYLKSKEQDIKEGAHPNHDILSGSRSSHSWRKVIARKKEAA